MGFYELTNNDVAFLQIPLTWYKTGAQSIRSNMEPTEGIKPYDQSEVASESNPVSVLMSGERQARPS